jgi:hypothetical protein
MDNPAGERHGFWPERPRFPVGEPQAIASLRKELSMITAIDGAFVSLSDGLPGSASRLL